MQNTSYEMRIVDWSSDVCSSDLNAGGAVYGVQLGQFIGPRYLGRYPERSENIFESRAVYALLHSPVGNGFGIVNALALGVDGFEYVVVQVQAAQAFQRVIQLLQIGHAGVEGDGYGLEHYIGGQGLGPLFNHGLYGDRKRVV